MGFGGQRLALFAATHRLAYMAVSSNRSESWLGHPVNDLNTGSLPDWVQVSRGAVEWKGYMEEERMLL